MREVIKDFPLQAGENVRDWMAIVVVLWEANDFKKDLFVGVLIKNSEAATIFFISYANSIESTTWAAEEPIVLI